MATANNSAARKLARLEKLENARNGIAFPAFDNGAAWLALTAELPAVAKAIESAPAGKYGNGKGLVPGASDMLALTAIGAGMASTGTGKNGKPNVQAATCKALAMACAALGTDKACKAAIVFFMLTSVEVLQLLHASRAVAGGRGVTYLAGTDTPCPRWAADYVQGNIRHGMITKA